MGAIKYNACYLGRIFRPFFSWKCFCQVGISMLSINWSYAGTTYFADKTSHEEEIEKLQRELNILKGVFQMKEYFVLIKD